MPATIRISGKDQVWTAGEATTASLIVINLAEQMSLFRIETNFPLVIVYCSNMWCGLADEVQKN